MVLDLQLIVWRRLLMCETGKRPSTGPWGTLCFIMPQIECIIRDAPHAAVPYKECCHCYHIGSEGWTNSVSSGFVVNHVWIDRIWIKNERMNERLKALQH